MKIHHNISLKEYNTFGIDVNARELIEVSGLEDIEKIAGEISADEKVLFLGEGSNILFTKNFDGLAIKSTDTSVDIKEEKEESVLISAGAGLNWDAFVEYTLNNNWFGLENLSLIPGAIGSSPVQNIGAYGVEACDFIEEVFYYDFSEKKAGSLFRKDCNFGYRNSIFKIKRSLFIYKVNFRLTKSLKINTQYAALSKHIKNKGINNPDPHQVRQAVIEIRESKLPDHKVTGNAGSFFKNPVIPRSEFEDLQKKHPGIPYYDSGDDLIKIPAGWLIEQAGWKGIMKGNAGVHKDQALVLINAGGAKGSEIASLAEEIRLDINKNFGIELYPEVNIL
ncbi:MAG: UDP-N-acetylenolpyruvoylglucosamine reductase [Marinilabiliales bacterium]|nr:MAG: UDP-N-acetylenolpyruvoylglucosamine reductase [Marinilabiliales bacterium]